MMAEELFFEALMPEEGISEEELMGRRWLQEKMC